MATPTGDDISRRRLLWLMSVSTGIALIGCQRTRGTGRPEPTVESVIRTVADVLNSEPSYPGVVSGRTIVANAFSGRGESEVRILAGRLYYDAVEKVRGARTGDPYSPDKVRRRLREPLPADRFDRPFFDGLLHGTEERMRNDAGFGRLIEGYSNTATAARQPCKCTINDEEYACWKCALAIAAIVLLAIVLAEFGQPGRSDALCLSG